MDIQSFFKSQKTSDDLMTLIIEYEDQREVEQAEIGRLESELDTLLGDPVAYQETGFLIEKKQKECERLQKLIQKLEEELEKKLLQEEISRVEENLERAEKSSQYCAARIENDFPPHIKPILELVILEEKVDQLRRSALKEGDEIGVRRKVPLPMQRIAREISTFMNLGNSIVLYDVKNNRRIWPDGNRKNGPYADLFHEVEAKVENILKTKKLLPLPSTNNAGPLTHCEKSALEERARKDWDASLGIQQAHNGNFKSYLGELLRHEQQRRTETKEAARKQQHAE